MIVRLVGRRSRARGKGPDIQRFEDRITSDIDVDCVSNSAKEGIEWRQICKEARYTTRSEGLVMKNVSC